MKLPMPRYIAKDRQRWRFDLPSPMPPGFEEVYLATDYAALNAERMRLEGQQKAKQYALEFAHAAISDAIYLEDGLDVETGQRVQRIVVEAMERGTFAAPTQIADFLTRRERQQQEYMSKLEQRVAELEQSLLALRQTHAAEVLALRQQAKELWERLHDASTPTEPPHT